MDVPLVDFKSSELHFRNSLGITDSFPHGRLSFEDSHANPEVTRREHSNLEEHEILTSCGIYQRVYVQPSQSKQALITYHDIGTNHVSFLGFFNYPEMRVITKHFTVYHICAPGHHENATTEVLDHPAIHSVDQSSLMDEEKTKTNGVGRSSTAASGIVASYPSLDQLAQMLTSILVHFGIDSFVGFGMGAGSNILTRFALNHPNKIMGLFLLNPTSTSHSYYQRFMFRWWEWSKMEQGFVSDSMMDLLYNHWFGYGLAENEDVVNFYHDLARSLNPANLAGYINAYLNRTPLTLIRPVLESSFADPASVSEPPTVVRADVCLVTGDRATDLARNVAEMNGCMDPKCTQFILIPDCTGMVMDENPNKLAVDFLHFLRSISLVITLTPEKLHQQATALQLHQVPGGCAGSIDKRNEPAQLDVVNEA